MAKQGSLELEGLVAPITCIFARHETFHPRFGWLKKGFDRAVQNPQVFLAEDATVQLGVGKNMVRSLRYWETAFKLLQNDQPTEFGTQLLGAGGWDPYLEDPASLWLLHWKLLEHTPDEPCQVTAWYVTFNYLRQVEFDEAALMRAVQDYRDRHSPRTADSSLKKDVSCLLRMYVAQSAKSLTSEDSLDCPFTQLGLIQNAGESRRYMFRVGRKANLPPAVIAYACLHYAKRAVQAQTIPIAKLLYDVGSPGLVFKLTESALCEAIETLEQQDKPLRLLDAAGKLQFAFEGDPEGLAEAILNGYY